MKRVISRAGHIYHGLYVGSNPKNAIICPTGGDEHILYMNYCYILNTVQITFIFIDFRVCDFAFAFKTQNAPCVSRFKRVLFSDRFQFAF